MKNKQSFFSEKNSVVQNTTTPEIARFGGPVVILEPVIDRFEPVLNWLNYRLNEPQTWKEREEKNLILVNSSRC